MRKNGKPVSSSDRAQHDAAIGDGHVHGRFTSGAGLPINAHGFADLCRVGAFSGVRHMRRSISRHPVLAVAGLAMAAGVAFEALQALTGLGGAGLERVRRQLASTPAVELIAVAVVRHAGGAPARRTGWPGALMTSALLAWTAGDLTWTLWLDNVANPPYPSLADAALSGHVSGDLRRADAADPLPAAPRRRRPVAGRRRRRADRRRGRRRAGRSPRCWRTAAGGFVAEAVNLAYPVGDFVLLIFVAVAYSLSGWRPGRAWLLLGAAVTVTAGADIVFVYQVANGHLRRRHACST